MGEQLYKQLYTTTTTATTIVIKTKPSTKINKQLVMAFEFATGLKKMYICMFVLSFEIFF